MHYYSIDRTITDIMAAEVVNIYSSLFAITGSTTTKTTSNSAIAERPRCRVG